MAAHVDTAVADGSHAKFGHILNFRDVGYTVNQLVGQKLMREGLLYRSAKPDDASKEDRRRLRDEIGIKTVMDLRTKTEHLNAAKKRRAELALPPVAHATTNAEAAEPLQIPGINYLEIKLTGKRFEKHLLSQLSWWSYIKLIVLFIFGLRMKAIAILGREVMLPRGLLGLATDTLDQSGPEFLQALSALLEPANLPLVVHCTQGKDRTGIIVILVLMILHVPIDAIDYDYQLSSQELQSEKKVRLAEIREIGLSDEFGDTAKGLVQGVASHLETTYGGLDGYLNSIGFDESRRAKLRKVFN